MTNEHVSVTVDGASRETQTMITISVKELTGFPAWMASILAELQGLRASIIGLSVDLQKREELLSTVTGNFGQQLEAGFTQLGQAITDATTRVLSQLATVQSGDVDDATQADILAKIQTDLTALQQIGQSAMEGTPPASTTTGAATASPPAASTIGAAPPGGSGT